MLHPLKVAVIPPRLTSAALNPILWQLSSKPWTVEPSSLAVFVLLLPAAPFVRRPLVEVSTDP